AYVAPERNMRAKGHGLEATEIVTIDAPDYASGNEREDVTIGEDHRAGLQCRNDTVFDLIEEVSRVHQRKGQARNSILGEQLVDVASDEIGATKAAGLHGEAFGFEPFLKKRDLRGAAGAVHAFDDDEAASDFVGIETDERFAEEGLHRLFLGNGGGKPSLRWLRFSEYRCLFPRLRFWLRLLFWSFACIHEPTF